MRIRAALLIAAIVATLAAPLAASTHTITLACHGTDRVLSEFSAGPATIYTDDRGYQQYNDFPADVRTVVDSADDPVPAIPGTGYSGGRLPFLGRQPQNEGPNSYWIYLESNQHAGLQTGGDHAVLGESASDVESDSCKATHNVGGASVGFDSILF